MKRQDFYELKLQLHGEEEGAGGTAAEEAAPAVEESSEAEPAVVENPFEPKNQTRGFGQQEEEAKEAGELSAEGMKALYEKYGEEYDQHGAGIALSVLEAIGLSKHPDIAEKTMSYVFAAAEAHNEQEYSEAVKHYGGTLEEPGERFNEAVGYAAKALDALERSGITGLREAFVKSGLDCNVHVLRTFEHIGRTLLGEDGNFSSVQKTGTEQALARSFFKNSNMNE